MLEGGADAFSQRIKSDSHLRPRVYEIYGELSYSSTDCDYVDVHSASRITGGVRSVWSLESPYSADPLCGGECVASTIDDIEPHTASAYCCGIDFVEHESVGGIPQVDLSIYRRIKDGDNFVEDAYDPAISRIS